MMSLAPKLSSASSLRRAAVLLALTASLPMAFAQYKVIGPDGKVTYTDQPPANPAAKVQPINVQGSGGVSAASLPPALREVAARYPVTLYAARNCQPCDAGRGLLVQRGIPFAEKRVESPADIDALQRLSGGRSLPLLTIGSQQVRSMATAEWQGYLDAAGYPRESALPATWKRPEPTPIVAVAAPAPSPASAPGPAPVNAAPANPNGPNIRF